MNMESEAGRKALAKAKEIAVIYKAPLIVFGVILAAVLLDYAFRSSDKDYYALGIEHMGKSQWDGAIKDFSRALRQNATDPASRFGLGWAYHSKGWLDEALKQYDSSGRAAADIMFFSNFNAGVILQAKGKAEDAAEAYRKAIAAKPDSVGALMNLGGIYSAQGKNDQAYQQYVRTTQVDPRNANAFYNAGVLAERLGRRDEARKHYQTAVGIDPNNSGARDRLKALGG